MKEQMLNPFRSGKQSGWCGAICKINNFIKYLEKNEPIIGGSWNPNEYVNRQRFGKFLEWIKNHYVDCLCPDDDDVLYTSMGTTYEDPYQQEHSVDIFEVVNQWIEEFAGKCIDGVAVKASPFGPIGIGSKYFADYYYEKGGILIQGQGDKFGHRRVQFVMFFPKKVWKAMHIAPQDITEYVKFEIEDVKETEKPKRFRVHCFENRDKITGQFASNTYESDSSENVLNCLKDLFENTSSGISKVIIEDNSFGIPFSENCMSPMNLDTNGSTIDECDITCPKCCEETQVSTNKKEKKLYAEN
mgnify:CR=1 FL=1